MNVAAYCRVSTDDDDQMNSLENQVAFFEEYIRNHDDWNFVGIYSDEGISGTSVKNRTQFNSMIQDALNGEIDFIVTKEVSRFARNTVDTLSYTRELRNHGVGVMFINDNINTLDGDGEFRLSIMASVAQEESRKISSRVKWGMKRQMEKGYVFCPPMLGYDIKDGVLTVNQEEAKIVRNIFDMYVNHNMGSRMIAKQLLKDRVPAPKRIKKWTDCVIVRILKNEKYVGDLIQQKTIVNDYLSHRSVINNKEKIVFKDHHEPIIDRSTWDEAQRIRERHNDDRVNHNNHCHANKYWCSGKIQCGICGGSCVSKLKHALYGDIRAYRCKHSDYSMKDDGVCTNRSYVDERILCACMQYVIKKISADSEAIKSKLTSALKYAYRSDESAKRMESIEASIEAINVKKDKLMSLLVDDVITRDNYKLSVDKLEKESKSLNDELASITRNNERMQNAECQISDILNQVDIYLNQGKITKEMYAEVLDKIIMYDDNHIDIFIKGLDMPFSVKYSRKGRGTQYTVTCTDY